MPSQPIFNEIPTLILVLCALMLGVHLLDIWLVSQGFAEIHGLVAWVAMVRTGTVLEQLPPAPLWGTSPFVLHVFVHFGWLHLLMNLGALLAFGSAVLRSFNGAIRAVLGFLTLFFLCAISGAVLASVVHMDEPHIMAGSSTAISGLIAAAGWANGGRAGMIRLAGPWLLINLGLAVASNFYPIPISWSGHIGGLLMGAIAYPIILAIFKTPFQQ